MTPWPAWLRLGLVLPLVGLNAFVIKRVLVQFAPFPGLFLTAALIAFLLDLPCRWLMRRGLARTGSIALVMLITIGSLALAAVALVPLLIEQLSQLISASPALLAAADLLSEHDELDNLYTNASQLALKLGFQNLAATFASRSSDPEELVEARASMLATTH